MKTKIMIGTAVAVYGLLVFLNNIGVAPFNQMWPLIIFIPGLMLMIINPRSLLGITLLIFSCFLVFGKMIPLPSIDVNLVYPVLCAFAGIGIFIAGCADLRQELRDVKEYKSR